MIEPPEIQTPCSPGRNKIAIPNKITCINHASRYANTTYRKPCFMIQPQYRDHLLLKMLKTSSISSSLAESPANHISEFIAFHHLIIFLFPIVN